MKTKTLRVLIPLAVMVIISIGFAAGGGIGTLSAVGWGDVSLLCPLGALTSMLASKTVVPRAVFSIAIAVVAILLLGRAFCGWVCPVPVVSKLREAFSKPKPAKGVSEELTPEEIAALKGCSSGCDSCGAVREKIDSRHFILGGALLSATIFGFPVFCLICPIGLTFAIILLVMLLFSGGDVTWSVVVIPALLLVEVVFFRKWCSKICPLAALMSLVSKGNKTFRPTIDAAACLESSKDAKCGRCAEVCPQGIDLRDPEAGASLSECIKCRSCVNACPVDAVSMPLAPARAIPAPVGQTPSADEAKAAKPSASAETAE